ncbi:MAG: hypothetical protein Q9160_008646 [Pyrenula sp. 1 TL-2023]
MSDIMELGFEAIGGPIANNADKATRKIKDAWNGQPQRSRSRHRPGEHQHHHQHIQDWQYQVDQEDAPAPRVGSDPRHENWDDWQFPPKQQTSRGGRPQMQRRASSLDRGMGNYYARNGAVERYRPQQGRDYDRYYTSDDSDSSYSRGASRKSRRKHQARKSEDLSRREPKDKAKDKDKDEGSAKDKVKNKLKGNEALVAGIATVGVVYAGSRFWSAYQNDKKRHEEMKKGSSKKK